MCESIAGHPTMATIITLLQTAGSKSEPNEQIPGLSILHHGLQCAARLRASDPDDPELQVAGLLHDVGHVLAPGCEDTHGSVAAAYVLPVFGERVAKLVEDHVPAKRYLVTADETYRARLSDGSARTLVLQGGSMTADESEAFRASAWFDAAVRLRKADESSKDPVAKVPPLDAWLPTLRAVAGGAGQRSP